MNSYLPLFISLGISSAVTPIVIKIAKSLNIYDEPDQNRKIHNNSIPLLGGIAIYVAFISTLLIFTELNQKTIAFVVISLIIVIMGVCDDIYDIPARIKLLIQIGCAFYMAISSHKINLGQFILEGSVSIYLFDLVITTLWIIGIMNAINLIDGVDGLAGGVAAIAGLGFAIIGYLISDNILFTISLSLIGGIIGFLFYNKNPAKIFMGDTGSVFLGYVLSILSIKSMDMANNPASLFAPIIILAVPIFDTGWAILRRLFSKKDIFAADRGHMHHRLLNKGYSQKKTVYIIYGISIVSLIVGLITYIGQYFIAGFLVILSLIILGIVMSLRTVHESQYLVNHSSIAKGGKD